MVNPALYRLDEALACWRRIEAPVLWVWGDGEWMRRWFKTGEEDLAERRAAFKNLTEVQLADCGHMNAPRPTRQAGGIAWRRSTVERLFQRGAKAAMTL
jgi:pimeloyl-ACP methyl ester carboxylesterase